MNKYLKEWNNNTNLTTSMIYSKIYEEKKKYDHWYKKGKEWREYLEKRKAIRKINDPYYNQYYE